MENVDFEINLPELGNFHMIVRYETESEAVPPSKDNMHIHDGIEFYVLEQGDTSFFVGGNLYDLTCADVIVTKPNEIHNCIRNSLCLHDYFCFWFSPACEVLLSDFLKHPEGKGNLIRLAQTEKKELLSLCHKTFDQARDGKTVSACSAAIALLELCRNGLYLFPEAKSMPKELIAVLQTIEEKMGSISSINELCEQTFISQSTLLRLFHRYLGVSPREYLEARRLAMARNYLNEGKSVTEAASLTGFSSTSVFIRLFHRRFGVTPLKFRHINQSE